MGGRGICADDHDAVFAGTGSAAQRQGYRIHAFAFDAGFVHGIAAIGRHCHDDFLGVVALLSAHTDASMGTAAHAIASQADYLNPNVVKVVLDARNMAHYFSRAPIPWSRDQSDLAWWHEEQMAPAVRSASAGFAPLRHVGIYSYRAGFLRQFPLLPPAPTEAVEALEQLRALWHGHRIAVHIAASAPGPGVDTPEDLEKVRAILALQGQAH